MPTPIKILAVIVIVGLAAEISDTLGTLVLLGLICWGVYAKFFQPRAKMNAALKQDAERHAAEQQRVQEAKPFIQKYLKAFTAAWTVWPTKVVLTPEDYASIRSLLLKEENINLSFLSASGFKKIIDDCVFQAAYQLFFTSFGKVIDSYLATRTEPPTMSKEFLVGRYYDTFSQNKTYIIYLVAFARNYGISLSQNEVVNGLHNFNRRMAIKKRSDAIKNAVAANQPIQSPFRISDVDRLDGVSFEKLLGKLYTQMGYEVSFTKASGDQGADLLLSKAGEKRIVQAKRYKDDISNTAVQEAVAAKAFYKIPNATVATNRYFTKGAQDLAAANGVELINRDTLIEWLRTYPIYK